MDHLLLLRPLLLHDAGACLLQQWCLLLALLLLQSHLQRLLAWLYEQ